MILKETRKYGLYLILATQNLIDGKGQSRLKNNLLNNTHVKVIGTNGFRTIKRFSQEIGIHHKRLLKLPLHFFWIHYGTKGKLVRTANVFFPGSPVLARKSEVLKQTNYLIYKSGYYKPILQSQLDIKDTLDDYPYDRHDRIQNHEKPLPKFSY